MPGTFADDIVVERVEPGRYRASLDHHWDLFPIPQGGILASFGLRAAANEVADPAQKLRTCTTVFAGQVVAGELEIDVTVLRHGRSASQILSTVRNTGHDSGLTTLSVYGSSRRGPTFIDVTPPDVPPPDSCRSWRDPPPPGVELDEPVPFWTRVEGRSAIGHAPWEDHDGVSSDVVNWLRFDDPPFLDDGTLDPLGVLTLADRMPGAVFERLGNRADRWFCPSADLTVHFFEPAATAWVLAHDRARWADDGWASAETTLWSENGTLLAYATQMMLFTALQG